MYNMYNLSVVAACEEFVKELILFDGLACRIKIMAG